MKIKMCDEFYYRISGCEEDIFKALNTCKENVLRNNQNLKLYNGEWVKIKQNDYVLHYVKPMETLDILAKKYFTEVEKIVVDNSLKTQKLFIGQQLKIYK